MEMLMKDKYSTFKYEQLHFPPHLHTNWELKICTIIYNVTVILSILPLTLAMDQANQAFASGSDRPLQFNDQGVIALQQQSEHLPHLPQDGRHVDQLHHGGYQPPQVQASWQPAHGYGEQSSTPGMIVQEYGYQGWTTSAAPPPRGFAVPTFFQQISPPNNDTTVPTVYVSWEKFDELLANKMANPYSQTFNTIYRMLYESFFMCRHPLGQDPRQLRCVCGQLVRALDTEKAVCVTQNMQQFGHHYMAYSNNNALQTPQHQSPAAPQFPHYQGPVAADQHLPEDLSWVVLDDDDGADQQQRQGGIAAAVPLDPDTVLPEPVPAVSDLNMTESCSSQDTAIAHRLRSRKRAAQDAADSSEEEDEDDRWLPSARRSLEESARNKEMLKRFSDKAFVRNEVYIKVRKSMAPATQLIALGAPPPSRWISDIMLETGNYDIPAKTYGTGRIHNWSNDGRASQEMRYGYKYTIAALNGTVLWPENSQEHKIQMFLLGLRYLDGSLQRKRRLNKQMKTHDKGTDIYKTLENCLLAEAEQYRLCSLWLGHPQHNQSTSRFIHDHGSKPGVVISGDRRTKIKDHWLTSWISWDILIPLEIKHLKELRATWQKSNKIIYPYSRMYYWVNKTPQASSHDPLVEQRGTNRERRRHR